MIRPPALKRGNTIGIVAPSYPPDDDPLARGILALQRAGYKVIQDPDLMADRKYNRKQDRLAAEHFMEFWLRNDIDGIIVSTGGYGAARLLPYLEPEVFRLNPKVFVGYSDITALHLWLNRKADLRTFHGPTVDNLIPGQRDVTTLSLLTALKNPQPTRYMGRSAARAMRGGRAVGRLTGGNLSLVRQSIGTSYEIRTAGAILFLEEVREPMSNVDEAINQLRAAGLLQDVRGIIFGQLSLDRSEEDEFEDFLLDLVSDLNVPMLMNFPAGHETPNLTLPLGTEIELLVEGTRGGIRYAEAALQP